MPVRCGQPSSVGYLETGKSGGCDFPRIEDLCEFYGLSGN